jgi:formylglycine-generating enzyme required for sulfatase activity
MSSIPSMRKSVRLITGGCASILMLVSLAGANHRQPCQSDAVAVGPLCVDKYEASVWHTHDEKTIKAIRAGKIAKPSDLAKATQHGAKEDDYGDGCPDNGNECVNFYAVSVPGAMPARYITWFQALAACRNAGKRLPNNAEWQMAALGTPDPGADGDGVKACNTTRKIDPVPTGTVSACVSDAGVYDMVGNVWEWVGDWMQDSSGIDQGDQSSRTYGRDAVFGINEAVPHIDRFPGNLIRGGSYEVPTGTDAGVFAVRANVGPSTSRNDMGFRCVR